MMHPETASLPVVTIGYINISAIIAISTGLTALPSSTNFIFVNLGDGNAEFFRQAMAEKDVPIRGIYRTYNNWSRVSMGKIADVKRYVDAMPAALEKMQLMQRS